MLNFLGELVGLSSETKDLHGVRQVQEKICARLEVLRARIRWIESESKDYGASLLASWGPDTEQGICIICHADTVYSTETLRPFELEQTSIARGGGVADNKGGVVIALAAIEKALRADSSRDLKRPLYLFCSSCEEMGSPGFQNFIKELSPKIDFALGMEPALPGGDLIRKRRGNRYYKFEILGNSVHTGRDAKDAANPVDGLIQLHGLLTRLRLKYPQLSVSLNGVESFPFKYNMSAEKICLTVDVRFDRYAEAKFFHEELQRDVEKLHFASLSKKYSGKICMELVDDCPSFESAESAELQQAREIYSRVEGGEVKLAAGLGASDCCYFARDGLQIIDGLGTRGGAIHSRDEFIEIESLEKRRDALAEYLLFLVNRD